MGFTLRTIIGPAAAERLEPKNNCPTGKVAYVTKEQADMALAVLNTRQTKMRRFRCPWCQQYHLGHRRGTV